MPTTRLIYVSRPTALRIGPDFLETCDEVLLVSRRNNAALGVTGALVASPDVFAQVLEGERVAVSDLFARIRRDPRHTDVVLLDMCEVAERRFARWSMAFCDRAHIPHDLARRFRHEETLDLARLSPEALLDFVVEAVLAQVDDNSLLGAALPIAVPQDLVFVEAAE